MIEERFGEEKFSSIGVYIRSTSDIPPKWGDIRNSYIPPNWDDIRNITDIPKLSEIGGKCLIVIRGGLQL